MWWDAPHQRVDDRSFCQAFFLFPKFKGTIHSPSSILLVQPSWLKIKCPARHTNTTNLLIAIYSVHWCLLHAYTTSRINCFTCRSHLKDETIKVSCLKGYKCTTGTQTHTLLIRLPELELGALNHSAKTLLKTFKETLPLLR